MARNQIEINGVLVDLRDRENVVNTIDEMLEEYSTKLKAGKVKTNKARNAELATLSFFGSISHYLKGGD